MTLEIFKCIAQNDEDENVRRAAINELENNFKDNFDLFDLWCHLTLNDPFEREKNWQENPRQIALNVLVQQYPTHPKTLELLQNRAQNDSDPKFKEWATQQLVKLE